MDSAFAIGRKNMGKSMNPAVFGQQNLPDHIEMIYRFNPYTAPQGDPVRARQLLSTEDYRVSWLHLQPRCIHTMKTYATTMVIFYIWVSINQRSNNSSGYFSGISIF